MKKCLKIFLVILGLTLCSSVLAKDGSGKIKFTERTLNNFLRYLGGEGVTNKGTWFKSGEPMAFAVSPSGKYSYYYYCPKQYIVQYGGCMPLGTVIGKAQNACKKEAGGSERCFIFAKKRKIVWNSINYKFPKELSTEFVKNKLKEIGFYGQQALKKEEKKKEPKKKKKKKPKKKTNENEDIVKKLKDLKELYDSGVLTKDEFEKAKKKLLN